MLDIRTVLIRGSAAALFVYVLAAGVAFALNVLLTRVMGVEHYGIYVFVLSWLRILVLFGKLGMDVILMRFVAAYTAREEWGNLAGVLGFANLLGTSASFFIGGSGVIVVWAFGERLSPELMWTFYIGFALLPIMALTQLRQAALCGLRQAAHYFPELVLRPVLLGAFVISAVFGFQLSVNGVLAIALDTAAALVAFVIASMWLRRSLPASLIGVQPVYHRRMWLAIALPLFLTSGMQIIHSQTDILMIGTILGTREAGIYSVAARISMLVLFGLFSVNAIAAPVIAEFHGTGKLKELQRMVSLAAKGILALTVPIALGLLVLGNWVLSLFGPEFPESYSALTILLAGQVVNGLTGSVAFLMTMTGHERAAAGIMAASVAVNVALNAALIPPFGIEGAATATAITTALLNISMLTFVYRRLGINPTVFRFSW